MARAAAYKKISRKRNREFIQIYLARSFCVDCGTRDVRVLEFDHVIGEKVSDVSVMVNHGVSLVKLKSEISKCAVRCANCHRIRTRIRFYATGVGE